MKLSRNSHRTIEIYFREFLCDESFSLPLTHFYAGNLSKFVTLFLKINGITIGRRVLVLPELVSLNRNNQKKLPEDLVVHEIMHVIQYKKVGFVKFLYKYLRDYWVNLRKKEKWNAASRRTAYLEIPFEIEARDAAQKFLEWKEKRKIEMK
ncbi:MAG: hypothetical protein M3Q99_05660 [Acidobacteriota bacterium]|nr:hypothetical protein [Acidobacteriota bacterium]